MILAKTHQKQSQNTTMSRTNREATIDTYRQNHETTIPTRRKACLLAFMNKNSRETEDLVWNYDFGCF